MIPNDIAEALVEASRVAQSYLASRHRSPARFLRRDMATSLRRWRGGTTEVAPVNPRSAKWRRNARRAERRRS